jgi:predicted porin
VITMKKTFVFAAVALLAGAAQAQVSVYGLIDMSYGKSVASDAAGLKADFHSGGDNGSGEGNSTTRLGVKGNLDVGSGMKANFKFETGGINSDGAVNPGGAFFNRQAWAGVSGGFGEVRLGRQDSVPFQTMAGFDQNGASNGVSAPGLAGVATWGTGRQSRSLQYISPKFGGLSVQAGFVPEGNVAGAKNNVSLGVSYGVDKLSAAVAYESKRVDGGEDFMSVSAGYDFGFAKFALGYADGGKNAKGLSTGVTVPVGAGITVGGQYARNSDTKGSAYELFVNKEVLKNTYAYFEAGKANAKTGVDGTGYALGLILVI